MERKHYLRGLGLGIIVTALLMGAFVKSGDTMTDEEVIERAKQLGMIEDTLLVEAAQEPETEAEAEDTEAPDSKETASEIESEKMESEETELEETESKESDAEETDSKESKSDTEKADSEVSDSKASDLKESESETPEPESSEAEAPASENAASEQASPVVEEEMDADTQQPSDAVITIVSGDSSVSVASKLQQAGIISSVASYDAYLCSNGYDKKIRTGTYTIPADAGDEEIARIITGMAAQP